MFKNLDNKTRAYGTLIAFTVIAIVMRIFSDKYSQWVFASNPWVVIIARIALNPAYLLLVVWLWHEYKVRGIVSGLFISIAIDIISLPHSIMAGMPQSMALHGYADTAFYKMISQFIGEPISSFIVYIIIPALLIYLAIRVIRRTASFNRIAKEAI